MANPISFQGLSTNLPTDSLISAIMDQEGQPIKRMQAKQALNSRRTSLLRTINSNLLALSTSLSTLANSSFNTRGVTSSDSTNTYASATASGTTPGTYDLKVTNIATKAQSNNLTRLATGSSAVGEGTYAILDTNGTTKTITITSANNTLEGFRDAINASGSSVTASIVNAGIGATPYQLVISANKTGTGTNGGSTFTLAQTSGTSNALGVATGTLDAGSNLTSGGTVSNISAQNASFTVNGVDMTRTSNTVTDAIDGMTITLKSGSPSAPTTTFTVAQDKTAATNALNDVVTKFNALLKTYKDGAANGGPLASDRSVRTLIENQRRTITLGASGLSPGNAFQSGADMGLKTNRDGTLSLDTTVFQAALDQNPTAVSNLFNAISSTLQSDVSSITSPGSGNIAQIISDVDAQNAQLTQQIASGQARLDRRKLALQTQFANLETTVGRLQSAGQSLGSLR